jgi:hypothetical protein
MSNDARIMTSLPSHPKTRKLIKRHGQAAAWNLICLFLFARDNKPDGDFSGMTAEDIELAADWQGEDGVFVQSLIDYGFIDKTQDGYQIHDWADHNPWAAGARKRSESAKQNAAKRWQGKCESDAVGINPHSGSHGLGEQLAENGNAPTPSPLPAPSPSPSPSPTPDQQQKQSRAAPIHLPSSIPADVWEMWNRYRNSKKGWNADAKALSLRTLAKLVADGNDPRAVVERSIERGYTGLFPVNNQPNGQAKPVDTWAGRDI